LAGENLKFSKRRQSEARNFQMAQHIHKQTTILFIRDKCATNGTKFVAITLGSFDATYRENVANYK